MKIRVQELSEYATVADMQDYYLVQDESSVKHYNKEFDQDYCYYFLDADNIRTFGSYSLYLNDRVWEVQP